MREKTRLKLMKERHECIPFVYSELVCLKHVQKQFPIFHNIPHNIKIRILLFLESLHFYDSHISFLKIKQQKQKNFLHTFTITLTVSNPFTKEFSSYNNYFHSNKMSTQTLFNIVNSIHVTKYRRSPHSIIQSNTSPWTFQEEKLFLRLIMQYGTDIGLIESFFPTRTRGQIKRKHRDVTMARKKMLQRFENKMIRQSRKSYFDEEILEQKMIKWISKPNKQGNSNSFQTI